VDDFDLVINLMTAKMLGLDVSATLLAPRQRGHREAKNPHRFATSRKPPGCVAWLLNGRWHQTMLKRWQNRYRRSLSRACFTAPETGRPFVLLPAEREFLKHAFKTDDDGKLL
jgi:hypothetical protein